MNLAVKKLDLIWDGDLPRDSMAGDMHRHLFGEAKPLIDYAFKVDRPAFVRVWWFDRQLERVIDIEKLGGRPKLGQFYYADLLQSHTDILVADYLAELGWQVRLALKSIRRQEYVVLAVFSPEGAILKEDEFYTLRSLTEEEDAPLDEAWRLPPMHDRPKRDEQLIEALNIHAKAPRAKRSLEHLNGFT